MKTAGIIAEYNPFHNGHLYHIARVREATGADAVVVILSGDFVQRGEPAIVDKYRRTSMALAGGADAVFELPVSFATGTAERFAAGGVRILHRFGVVTDLGCGSECPDSGLWSRLTDLFNHPTAEYQEQLQAGLAVGRSYPDARARAAEAVIPGAAEILAQPNNILALEYRRAISRIPDCRITPHEIRRVGSAYHDETLRGTETITSSGEIFFPSASAIRRLLLSPIDTDDAECSTAADSRNRAGYRKTLAGQFPRLHDQVPPETLSCLDYAVSPEDLSPALRYTLLMHSPEEIAGYQDMNPDLANRLYRIFREHPEYTFTQFAMALKNRSVTLTRCQRALLHTVLQLSEVPEEPSAVRLLGFRRGTPVLRQIMDQTTIPVITKPADAPAGVLDQDVRASRLYRQLVYSRTGISEPDEMRRGPIIF